MALIQVDNMYCTYIALTTDVVDNKIAGASKIGGIVYLTNSGAYKIILPDLTLADFKQPVVV